MKKLLTFIMSSALALSLAACSSQSSSAESSTTAVAETMEETTAEEAGETEAAAETTAPEGEAAETETSEETTATEGVSDGGTLVAYFSWSGNTEQMAQMIADETGADIFEIAPATPYTDDYNELLDIAQQEQADNARPELADQVENWDGYDTVFVGYPDWWSDAPMLIYSFLESYDWTGKTLIPFCTSGGSGFGRSLDKLPDSAQGATILEGLHVSGSSVGSAADDISAWIGSLDLS